MITQAIEEDAATAGPTDGEPSGQPARAASRRSADPRHHGEILATAKGSGVLAIGSLFEFASRFAIAFLLARTLGADDYGLYVMAISAAALFAGIAQIGLDDAMVRYVAILSGRRDHAGLGGAMQLGLAVSTVVGIALGAVLFFAAAPISSGMFDEPQLAELLRIVAFLVPLLTMSNVLAGIARGYRRMDFVALGENGVQSIVRIVLVGAIFFVGDLTAFQATVIFGLSDVAATITLIVLLARVYPMHDVLAPNARRDTGPIFRFALPLWFSGLLRQFRNNIQTIILGTTGSIAGVGIYAVVDKVNLVSHVWLLSVLVAVKPTMARLHDQGNRDALSQLYRTATRWTLSLYLPFFFCTVIFRHEILDVFGSEFASGATALVILAVAELANAATGVCGPLVDMTGHTRVKMLNSLIWTALLIGSGAVLIPRWGIIGAATSALAAIATVNLLCVIEMWMLERLLPFDRTFLKPVVAGTAALAVGAVLNVVVPSDRFLVAVLEGGAVFGVYLLTLMVLGLETEDRLVLERTWHRLTSPLRRGRHPRKATTPAEPARPRDEAVAASDEHAIQADDGGPIFVGGLDRSGKSTLSAFLTSHSRISIPPVGTNMWTYFYGRFGDLRVGANLDRCLDAMLRYTHVLSLQPDPERIRREFAAGPQTYGRLFELFHLHYAHREGKVRWGAQTGLVERYADQLFEAYPDVKVLHMVRDPRDRFESSRSLWPGGRGGAGAATARWRYSMRLASRNARRHPDNYLVVRFEDLVREPETTLRGTCAFIGERFEPAMLEMGGAPARRERLREQSTATSGDLLSTEFIGLHRNAIRPNELAFIQLHAGRLMRAQGYELEPVDMGLGEWARFAVLDWPDQMARMVAWRAREAAQQHFPGRVRRDPDRRTIVGPAVDGAR